MRYSEQVGYMSYVTYIKRFLQDEDVTKILKFEVHKYMAICGGWPSPLQCICKFIANFLASQMIRDHMYI